MALSTAVVSVSRKFKVGRCIRLYGTVAIGASALTYATGGIVMDFSNKAPGCRKTPLWVQVEGNSGHKYEFVYGTTIANGLLEVRIATTTSGNLGLSEHSAAAVDATVSGDTIHFTAEFDALN